MNSPILDRVLQVMTSDCDNGGQKLASLMPLLNAMGKSMSELPVVLVTGGAGYIGSHAVLALKDAGIPAVVYDNLSTGVRSAVPDDITLVEGDIGDTDHLARAIREHRIGAVMHFAGSIVVSESVGKPL